jgi:hypothetical protein
MALTTHPSSAEVVEKVELYLYSPLWVFVACSRVNCNVDRHVIAFKFSPDTARKLLANLYDIYHCCVHSENLLMMDRGTVRNM